MRTNHRISNAVTEQTLTKLVADILNNGRMDVRYTFCMVEHNVSEYEPQLELGQIAEFLDFDKVYQNGRNVENIVNFLMSEDTYRVTVTLLKTNRFFVRMEWWI